jgi:hypothetical protein
MDNMLTIYSPFGRPYKMRDLNNRYRSVPVRQVDVPIDQKKDRLRSRARQAVTSGLVLGVPSGFATTHLFSRAVSNKLADEAAKKALADNPKLVYEQIAPRVVKMKKALRPILRSQVVGKIVPSSMAAMAALGFALTPKKLERI